MTTIRSLKASAVSLVIPVVLSGCAAPDPQSFEPPGASNPFREEGAPWTILCLELRGRHRKKQIEQFAESLRATPGMDRHNIFVWHDDDGVSRLYHGVYYRKTDPKTSRRSTPAKLTKDVASIKELVGAQGERFFLGARTVRWPYPDVGRRAWRLSNARGVYSLQVAVFEPTDEVWDIKGAAAAYCEELRDKGFEAFYHHGEGASMVTVGEFGEDAVIPRAQGLPVYSAAVTRLQQQDELLKYNRLNGAVYTARSQTGEKVRVQSRLVRIPRSDEQSW